GRFRRRRGRRLPAECQWLIPLPAPVILTKEGSVRKPCRTHSSGPGLTPAYERVRDYVHRCQGEPRAQTDSLFLRMTIRSHCALSSGPAIPHMPEYPASTAAGPAPCPRAHLPCRQTLRVRYHRRLVRDAVHRAHARAYVTVDAVLRVDLVLPHLLVEIVDRVRWALAPAPRTVDAAGLVDDVGHA